VPKKKETSEVRRKYEFIKANHSALGYRPPAPEVVLPNDGIREMETGQKAA
jgi:hypothetical protein